MYELYRLIKYFLFVFLKRIFLKILIVSLDEFAQKACVKSPAEKNLPGDQSIRYENIPNQTKSNSASSSIVFSQFTELFERLSQLLQYSAKHLFLQKRVAFPCLVSIAKLEKTIHSHHAKCNGKHFLARLFEEEISHFVAVARSRGRINGTCERSIRAIITRGVSEIRK